MTAYDLQKNVIIRFWFIFFSFWFLAWTGIFTTLWFSWISLSLSLFFLFLCSLYVWFRLGGMCLIGIISALSSVFFTNNTLNEDGRILQTWIEANEIIADVSESLWEKGNIEFIGIFHAQNKSIRFKGSISSGLGVKVGGVYRFSVQKYLPPSKYLLSQKIAGTLLLSPQEQIVYLPSLRERSREFFLQKLLDQFPKDVAALLAGMLTGEKSLFSEELMNLFRKSGIAHIVVVSGSNITYVILASSLLLRPFHRFIRITWVLAILFLFLWFVWFDAPVLRAFIMGILAFLLLETNQSIFSFRLLLLASVVLILYSPYSLFYDAWFWLSVLATLGILVFLPFHTSMTRMIWGLSSYLLPTLAATVFTLPITIWTFWSFAPFSLVANVLIAPIIGFLLLSGAIALCAYIWIGGVVSYFFWYIPYFGSVYILWIGEFFWNDLFLFSIHENHRWLFFLLFLFCDIYLFLLYLSFKFPRASQVADVSEADLK